MNRFLEAHSLQPKIGLMAPRGGMRDDNSGEEAPNNWVQADDGFSVGRVVGTVD
jgi:hypothetical protein